MDVTTIYTDAEWCKIAGPHAAFLTIAGAREMLAGDPSARIYALSRVVQPSGVATPEIVRMHTLASFDRYSPIDGRVWAVGLSTVPVRQA